MSPVTVIGGGSSGGSMGITRLTRNAVQSIANNTSASISWTTEEVDDLGIFNPASADRVTIAVTGKYKIAAGVGWVSGNATGARSLTIRRTRGGTDVVLSGTSAAGVFSTTANNTSAATGTVDLQAGDEIAVRALQTSGAAMDTRAEASTFLTVERVA